MSLVLEHQGQSVRAVSLCHSLSHFSVICTEHMSTRAITHWLLMEHKTEVDLPFTVGSTAASLTHSLPQKQKQTTSWKSHIFYELEMYFIFFFTKLWQSILFNGKKKRRLFPQRRTMDCFAGGKIAVIEMVMSSLYLITFVLRCILWVAIWVIVLSYFLPLCLSDCF